MKLFLVLLLLMANLTRNPGMDHLRNLYAGAPHDEAIAKQLIRETENEKNNPVAIGYYGAAKMLMSKYYFNPASKLNSFNSGKKILESAIKSDRLNPELRYIRLTIQKNSPSFLGYNDNIEEDKAYLVGSLPGIKDEELKTIIKKFLKIT